MKIMIMLMLLMLVYQYTYSSIIKLNLIRWCKIVHPLLSFIQFFYHQMIGNLQLLVYNFVVVFSNVSIFFLGCRFENAYTCVLLVLTRSHLEIAFPFGFCKEQRDRDRVRGRYRGKDKPKHILHITILLLCTTTTTYVERN